MNASETAQCYCGFLSTFLRKHSSLDPVSICHSFSLLYVWVLTSRGFWWIRTVRTSGTLFQLLRCSGVCVVGWTHRLFPSNSQQDCLTTTMMSPQQSGSSWLDLTALECWRNTQFYIFIFDIFIFKKTVVMWFHWALPHHMTWFRPLSLINMPLTKSPCCSFIVIFFPWAKWRHRHLWPDNHRLTVRQPGLGTCGQEWVYVCACDKERERERERERVRGLLQTRSINSSNGFDPSRLTTAINIRASLPCLPTSRTTSRRGGQASV